MTGKDLGNIPYNRNIEGKIGDIIEDFIDSENPSINKHIKKAFDFDEKAIKFDFTFVGPLSKAEKKSEGTLSYFSTPDREEAIGKQKLEISHIYIKPSSFIIFKRKYYIYLLRPKGCTSKSCIVKGYEKKTEEEEVRFRSIASVKLSEKIETFTDFKDDSVYEEETSFIRIRGAEIYDIYSNDTNEMNAAIKRMNRALDKYEDNR